MYLVRLVYVSSIGPDFQPDDLGKILESAQQYNKKNHVTGLLGFNRKIFLQCLEGSRAKVNETYHRILQDPRHDRIIMLDYKEIPEREFDGWSMGFIPESSLTTNVNLRFSGDDTFDPYEMSGESAHRLMVALKDSLPLNN